MEVPANRAAWQTAPKVNPLEVKSAPYTSPREGEIVVKNCAVAVNPVDYIIQDLGKFMFSWLKYPLILGLDTTGKVIEVGPGSTSVGSNAIQLAVAAGYSVMTTCSPRNFGYVKRLGASLAFDYNSPTVDDDLIRAFRGKNAAGALSIGHRAAEHCLTILAKCSSTGENNNNNNNNNKLCLSMATYPVPKSLPKTFVVPTMAATYLSGMASLWLRAKTRGIRTAFIFGSTLLYNEVGRAIYVDFLPRALAEGTYVAAPEPEVVGKGLESVQVGYDKLRKGVSAKKVVVSLE